MPTSLFLNPLRRSATAALVAFVLVSLAVRPARAITIDMVTVSDPGNAPDSRTGSDGTSGYGAVAYPYQIGKYSVTIGQYTAFLNAADPGGTNPNGIYNEDMGLDLNIAGISYDAGASAGSKYAVMNNGGDSSNRPICYVSWFDAARFANWMTNGQGSGSTETGAYTLNGATSGNAVAANAGAAFRIPTENEWYKAAYYSPNYGGVGVPGYYAYATQSDAAPGNVIGSGANQANYRPGQVFSVTQVTSYSSSQNYLTDGGAFSGSGSFYGTFDQTGMLYDVNDLDGTGGPNTGRRGGYWYQNSAVVQSSSFRFTVSASTEVDSTSFRLVSPVPEPSTCAMALAGLACGGISMWRRRRRA